MVEASYLFLVDPAKLKGLFITGQSSKEEYKKQINTLVNSLSDIEYVFASMTQIFKKGVIDNSFPTLAIAFNENEIDSLEKY